jgi:GDPmannose 4,6-dehydratase
VDNPTNLSRWFGGVEKAMARSALITGVSGQDGAYLSKLLLQRGYRIFGQVRRDMLPNKTRLAEIGIADEIEFVAIDLHDLDGIRRELERLQPHEIYNLAGPSSVASSFAQPMLALEVNAVAAARLLEAARLSTPQVRFFQASTSEMFGKVTTAPQSESTPFQPHSPYAVAKLFSHWQAVCYRQSYGFFAACGIMFNHESPLRPRRFVTRKITSELAEVKHGRRDRVALGNLDARRDWGFAGDYVEGMWRLLQQREPSDYVFATGVSNSVRRFAELAASCLGMPLEWSGSGVSEIGVDRRTGRVVIEVDPRLFRPVELWETVGDARRARQELGWSPSVDFEGLVTMMAIADERRLIENRLLE